MDSAAPVVFKRKGTTKTAQRARGPSGNAEESEANTSETGDDSPSTLATKLKKKIQKSRPKSRLSFGVEDDETSNGEVFQLKKSKLSQRVTLGTHPAVVASALEQAHISTEGPRYDAAHLNELKASTPSSRPRTSTVEDSYDADMPLESGIMLAQVSDMDVDIDGASVAIPSESTIKVAKEKRGKLRKGKFTPDEDFISLSVIRRDDASQGPHPESRLVREEDEIGEGEDEFADYTSAQERIALGKKSRKLEASKRRDEMIELIADAEEEDEETAEWEQKQLHRGGLQVPGLTTSNDVKKIYKPTPIPPSVPVPSMASAVSRLSERLTLLTSSHAKNSASLSSLAQERTELDDKEKELREMVSKAEEKRAWFKSFKDWVEGVAGFLDEKYPLLEKIEDEYMSLLTERTEIVAKRRTQDDEDDISICLGSLPIPSSRVEDTDTSDECGRAVPKPNPLQERRQRRVARVARRQLRSSREVGEEEGYSTDSSLAPPDASAYSEALQSLTLRKKEILSDVGAEEFHDPGKGRWRTWREDYSDSYIGAWGGLGVVSVWEFWMRLESLGWNCIDDDRSLHSFKWYQGLYEYCRPGPEDISIEEREIGPDGDLVASIISTAVIPLICKILDGGALDVYSLNHVRRVIDLCEEIEASLESENPKFQLLLTSVTKLFQDAVSDTETSLAKYRSVRQVPGFNPDSITARRRFLARRVKLLKNLLIWIKYTQRKLEPGVLVGRLVDVCIMEMARSGWDVGGEEVARKVANLLPDNLMPLSLNSLR